MTLATQQRFVVCQREGCRRKLRGRQRKFCSPDHRKAQFNADKAERRRVELGLVRIEASDLAPRRRGERGEVHAQLVGTGLWRQIDAGQLTQKAVAELLGVSPTAIAGAMVTIRHDEGLDEIAAAWEPPPAARRCYGPLWQPADNLTDAERDELRAEGLLSDDDPHGRSLVARRAILARVCRKDMRLDRLCTEIVDAFVEFRDRFFRTEWETKYITKGFHRRWIKALMKTLLTGGEQLILSPPRHGKTDLLIHFCVWLIVVFNPNIRIGWIGRNEKKAKQAVGAVKRALEEKPELVEWFAGEVGRFHPLRRTGAEWGAASFTVATRWLTDLKAPTMHGVGGDSALLSADFDIIIVDDPQDYNNTKTLDARDAFFDRFVSDLDSRSMTQTAIFVITSRVHPDDLTHRLTKPADDAELDLDWSVIIESAHIRHPQSGDDPDGWHEQAAECRAPERAYDQHVDCMLFPEVNDYRWLRKKYRLAARKPGGITRAKMVYLNTIIASGLITFARTDLEECRDFSRGLGRSGIPRSAILVAGLDPSASANQVAFLWAIDIVKDWEVYYMVDMVNQWEGGIEGGRQIVREWYEGRPGGREPYRCMQWYVETNAQQRAWHNDAEIRRYCAAKAINWEPHHTGDNKWDPDYGVSAMVPFTRDVPGIGRRMNLPYGTPEARERTDLYIARCANWHGFQSRTKRTPDELMASWLPIPNVPDLRVRYAGPETRGAPPPDIFGGMMSAPEVFGGYGSRRKGVDNPWHQ